jgi:hypothetical protein
MRQVILRADARRGGDIANTSLAEGTHGTHSTRSRVASAAASRIGHTALSHLQLHKAAAS